MPSRILRARENSQIADCLVSKARELLEVFQSFVTQVRMHYRKTNHLLLSLFFLAYIYLKILFYIGVQLINNVLVSGVQHSDSVIHIYVSILLQILFPFRLLQNIGQSSFAIQQVLVGYLFIYLLATPRGLQDLSSLTRDRTRALSSGQ